MPNLGIYIHIPFCSSKCSYCDFYSKASETGEAMNSYVKALIQHITEAGQYMGKHSKGGFSVDTIYIGGGTPTILGAGRLNKLLKSLKKNFNLVNKCEITLEANPNTVDIRALKKLRKSGFNRISFGVQAAQNQLLEVLGRVHTIEQAADAVRDAADAGFLNISVDVMYGIPGQTRANLSETLRTVCSWRITHVSLYGLTVEPNTPLEKAEPILPTDEESAEMYLESVELLHTEGFKQYEISNFSKQGYICRHNYKYWALEPYIGFGVSAHSDFGNKRYSFIKDIEAYIAGVRDQNSLMEEKEANQLPMEERACEYIMLGLRTTNGISSNEYTRKFRANFDTIEEKLNRCTKWGLAQSEGDRWRLTPKGFLVSNKIINELLDTRETTTPQGLK